MSNDDVLEQNGQKETSSVDIVELLAAANSKVFDDQNSLLDTSKNFEKVSSFFDLIKSSNNEDTNLAEQDRSPESSAEEVLDEELVGLKISSLDGTSADEKIDKEIVGLKVSSLDGASDDEEIDEELNDNFDGENFDDGR